MIEGMTLNIYTSGGYDCGYAVKEKVGIIFVNLDNITEMERNTLFKYKKNGMTANAFLRYVRPAKHDYQVHQSGGDQWEYRTSHELRELLEKIANDITISDIHYFKKVGNEVPLDKDSWGYPYGKTGTVICPHCGHMNVKNYYNRSGRCSCGMPLVG